MTNEIPLELLFGDPERESPRMSPDGSKIAWLAPSDGVLNVWVAPVDAADGVLLDRAEPVTQDRDRGIRNLRWSASNRTVLYLQDVDGDENWHVVGADVDSKRQRDYTPLDGIQAKILAVEPARPDAILLGINAIDTAAHDVYRLDLASGQLTTELANPGFMRMLADANLVVRAGLRRERDGSLSLLARQSQSAAWRKLLAIPADDAMTTRLISFADHGRSLILSSALGANYCRLLRLDVRSGATEVLAQDAGADLKDVRICRATGQPQIAVFCKERLSYQILDESVSESFAKLRALHHGDPVFVDSDRDDRAWLVGFVSDAAPVEYFRFSVGTGQSQRLFASLPKLARYALAELEPFTFAARDGMRIPGYVIFPPGGTRSNLPAVVAVHGGPWEREAWEYEAVGQWIANRGYLCIKVNFRGSAGYGKDYLNAGDREWGGKMQHDVSDAVAHVIRQGWADPGRIAIIGGSYGGYSALAGLAFTPDLYRCGVSLYGPSNLVALLDGMSARWPGAMSEYHRRVGHPADDRQFLWQRSPLSAADRIKAPVLLAHGRHDARVLGDGPEGIVRALRRNGVEHEYLVFDDEGHGFAKPENRFRVFGAAEKFLSRHLASAGGAA